VAACSQAPWLTTLLLNCVELLVPLLLPVQKESNRKLAADVEELLCVENTFPSAAFVCQS